MNFTFYAEACLMIASWPEIESKEWKLEACCRYLSHMGLKCKSFNVVTNIYTMLFSGVYSAC